MNERKTTVNSATNVIRLLLVDDHEMVRLGLRSMLDDTPDVQVVGDVGTAAGAVAEAIRLQPDVVLMDVRLPDRSGAEACLEIRSECPNTRVLFLTSFTDELAMLTAVAGGAQGYVVKEIGREALIRAIKTVVEGHSVLDPSVTKSFLAKLQAGPSESADPRMDMLSSQELRVLALVAEGKTNKEIATELNLSDKTIKNYLSHVFQKLNVARRSQAAALFAKRTQ